MKFLVIILIFFISCNVPKRLSLREGGIPFGDVWFKLRKGIVNDSVIYVDTSIQSSFNVRFDENRFRGFDGGFQIRGTSRDSNSVYFTTMPYSGFYKKSGENEISLQWFRNISWSMDFNRHKMSKTIGELFKFDGKYDYNSDFLILYKQNQLKKDTIIVMKRN